MKIYQLRFIFNQRVHADFVDLLIEKGYHVLKWENGVLEIATDAGYEKVKLIAEWISQHHGTTVHIFSWPVEYSTTKPTKRLGLSFILDEARARL